MAMENEDVHLSAAASRVELPKYWSSSRQRAIRYHARSRHPLLRLLKHPSGFPASDKISKMNFN